MSNPEGSGGFNKRSIPVGTFYKARIHCWRCPYGEGISREFTVRTWRDSEGIKRWCFAKGQKPRGWYVDLDEGTELNFYDAEGNDAEPSADSIGTIYGLCPKCNKELTEAEKK
jgi:hypothetical protein